MKSLFLSLLVIASLVFMTACPKETAVRRAAKASYSLSGLTVDAIKSTATAYNAQIISIETKDKIAVRLEQIAKGGKSFNDLLTVVAKVKDVPPDKLALLNQIFSDEVVAPFLALLGELKVLSPSASATIRVSINALRSAILIISGTFQTAGLPVKGDLNYA